MKIIGTGSALPERIVSNDDLAQIMETSDEWIRSRTGIGTRHLATVETTTSLSVEAAKRAMEAAQVDPEEIDLIIAATLTPDNVLPTLACEVQAELGAVNAVAFDLVAACSGFMFGLATAGQLALAHHTDTSFLSALGKFMLVFAPTQVPLAMIEGLITMLIVMGLENYAKPELRLIGFLEEKK